MEYAMPMKVFWFVCFVLGTGALEADWIKWQNGTLFPYGNGASDIQMSTFDKPDEISLSDFSVNFYGRKYKKVYVSIDGLLGFDKDAKYQRLIWSKLSEEASKDKPFIAPFHYRGEDPPSVSDYQGKIWHREITPSTGAPFLTYLQLYIENATIGHRDFKPVWAFVVTWANVAQDPNMRLQTSTCLSTEKNQCPGSTFQLVLVASSTHTFAIFNYGKMGIQLRGYYQAGMNGGNGIGWTAVVPQENLPQIQSLKGSDVTGRYIFDVTGDIVVRGGCVQEGRIKESLAFSPTYAGMWGGEMIDVSGSCIPDGATVKCKFGTEEVQGFRVNYMKARCPVPTLSERGQIDLSFSVNNGASYNLPTKFRIVLPGRMPQVLTLDMGDSNHRWNETDAKELSLTWDPQKLTPNTYAQVDVNLIGYRETDSEVIWQKLKTIGTNVKNSGRFSFKPADHRCSGDQCNQFEIGLIEVVLHSDYWADADTHVALRQGILPLGWFMVDAMKEQYGDTWPVERCVRWYNEDRKDMSWLNDLLDCPCTLNQALTDVGRWQPDEGCNIFTGSICHYHIGAAHCVRSVEPTPKGAGNQCCYDKDGVLKYAADSFQGSTPDRSHTWGAAPYNKPGFVPSASHWIEDVITFYYCCLWTNYDYCDYYMDQRGTRDCKNYKTPKSAIAYGDPHITTFNGHTYNFGGQGEFWMVKTDVFQLQGSFSVPKRGTLGNYNTTILSAVALSGTDSSDKVEINLSPSNTTSKAALNVFVGGKLYRFDDSSSLWQDFKGLSIVNVEQAPNYNGQRNFTILLAPGIGVQVAETQGLLHVTVNLPPQLKTKTNGLLGTWDDNTEKVFTTRNGTQIYLRSGGNNERDFFDRFGLSWKVKEETESLFRSHADLKKDYNPNYHFPSVPPGSSFTSADVDRTCGDNRQCMFDFMVSGNVDLAKATLKTSEWFKVVQSFQTSVESCGLLDVPRSTKDNYNYTLGSKVTVTGCRSGESLEGDTAYECVKDQSSGTVSWSPDVTATCSGGREDASVGLIVGLTVAGVALVVIIVVIVIVVVRRRSGSRKDISKSEPEVEKGQGDAMMSDIVKRQRAEEKD